MSRKQYFEQDSWPQIHRNKYGVYRLMQLTKNRKVRRVTCGSIEYLLKLPRKNNRRWIELNIQPAVIGSEYVRH